MPGVSDLSITSPTAFWSGFLSCPKARRIINFHQLVLLAGQRESGRCAVAFDIKSWTLTQIDEGHELHCTFSHDSPIGSHRYKAIRTDAR
jgi:hypothetical protein